MKPITLSIAFILGLISLTAFSPVISDAYNGLTLRASHKNVKKGQEVCIDVTAEGFRGIMSMQYTMKWDRKVLKFKEVKGFGLPGMGKHSFGQQAVEKGLMTFSWYDSKIRGIHMADGTMLYQVCYEAIGDAGKKAFFQFANSPTIIEISNSEGAMVDLKPVHGVIKVE